MFGNKNLATTIAKVTSFITDLEAGVAENEKLLKANNEKVTEIKRAETEKIESIRAKAVTAKMAVTTKSAVLLGQNAVASKLLSKLL